MSEKVILSPSEANLKHATGWLAAGKLVAFPTETVYGLGGNALSEEAVRKIYATKGRPATDPLICHVSAHARALALWDPAMDAATTGLASAIGKALWPGPLTIVCRAHPDLPLSVTGGSGFVGSRIPNHPVTLQLLELVDFPLAGPSANTFGHVSPTTPQHVYDDLAARDPELLILDGGSCAVGIESTVVKIASVDCVEVLRRGKVSVADIQQVIAAAYPQTRVTIRDTRSKFTGADQPMDGPGQMLTHYAPGAPCSLLTPGSMPAAAPEAGEVVRVRRGTQTFPLAATVVIDFRGALRAYRAHCLAYRDLSEAGDVLEACTEVFEALRWTERVEGAEAVVFPLLSEWAAAAGSGKGVEGEEEELLAAVEDRLFRAASGTTALLEKETQ